MRVSTLSLLCLALLGCKPAPVSVTSPKPIENPMPDAETVGATEAAQSGVAGRVTVAYCVEVDGTTSHVTSEDSPDPEYDAIAIATVQRWTFEPATRNGEPIQQCNKTNIAFAP